MKDFDLRELFCVYSYYVFEYNVKRDFDSNLLQLSNSSQMICEDDDKVSVFPFCSRDIKTNPFAVAYFFTCWNNRKKIQEKQFELYLFFCNDWTISQSYKTLSKVSLSLYLCHSFSLSLFSAMFSLSLSLSAHTPQDGRTQHITRHTILATDVSTPHHIQATRHITTQHKMTQNTMLCSQTSAYQITAH